MNKNEMKLSIFDAIINNGVKTNKADVMGENPMEDKVYTKRINIDKPYKDGINIMAVSLTSDTDDFNTKSNTDIAVRKIRVNTKNAYDKWINFFINEAPTDMVKFIYETVCV